MARLEADLADAVSNHTFEVCDADIYFRSMDEARERLARAEGELIHARYRSSCRLRNWDGTVDQGHLLGIEGDVATVRFQDGRVQTMDRNHFWDSLLP